MPGPKKPISEQSASRDQRNRDVYGHRLKRMREQGLKPPIKHAGDGANEVKREFALDCGWGRLVFAQTFDNMTSLAQSLGEEKADRRDIAVYVRDPHVLVACAPQEIFLDPSHTYRLDLAAYRASKRKPKGFFIRRLTSRDDADAINRIYALHGMVPVSPEFFWSKRDTRSLCYFVAEDENTGEILGTATGVDHYRAFGDPERGSSLWCLAVDPQVRQPGVGEALVRRLSEFFAARGAAYIDLSVMHDNDRAINLYEKLGFKRVAYFSAKRKNPFNEMLYTGAEDDATFNPYARIVIREARRRGIHVQPIDPEVGMFRLSHGGRTIRCRESLSELTSAVAMSICDDKAVTRRIVAEAGVEVPDQISAGKGDAEIRAFLHKHGSVVVKPARGEQGCGISIDLRSVEEVEEAVKKAREVSEEVLIEQLAEGSDLRLIVIDFKLVAAAVRRPATIFGDGTRDIGELIEVQSRRRAAATGGESRIPLDDETGRTIAAAGFTMDSVLPEGEQLIVRKTANLHTGGTIHDVTELLHPALADAAVKAAEAIDIPVVGIDFMVKSPDSAEYAFIEANERPGLANHEPQPTAECFVDLLFPLSRPAEARRSGMTGEAR